MGHIQAALAASIDRGRVYLDESEVKAEPGRGLMAGGSLLHMHRHVQHVASGVRVLSG